MAIPARTMARLTVLPGGRSLVTARLDEIEEGWIEVQAIAGEYERFAASVLAAARRIELAIAADQPGIAGQLAHELELAAPMNAQRARKATIDAQLALDRIHPEPVA